MKYFLFIIIFFSLFSVRAQDLTIPVNKEEMCTSFSEFKSCLETSLWSFFCYGHEVRAKQYVSVIKTLAIKKGYKERLKRIKNTLDNCSDITCVKKNSIESMNVSEEIAECHSL